MTSNKDPFEGKPLGQLSANSAAVSHAMIIKLARGGAGGAGVASAEIGLGATPRAWVVARLLHGCCAVAFGAKRWMVITRLLTLVGRLRRRGGQDVCSRTSHTVGGSDEKDAGRRFRVPNRRGPENVGSKRFPARDLGLTSDLS
jgi:hypothetical protein